jgi:hypothetical protein
MTDHPEFLTKKSVDKLWWICDSKFRTLLPSREEKHSPKTYRKKRIELWLGYLESNGIQVRRSREYFYRFEELVVLSGFSPRRSYKIGIPYDLAEKIFVLGSLP